MRKERTDQNLSFDIKAKVWIGEHFKQILIASFTVVILSLVYVFYATSKYASIMEYQSRAVENMANKVLVLSPDGRVLQLAKKELSEYYALGILRNMVLSELLLDGNDFRLYNVMEVKEVDKNPKIKQMLNYFDDTKSDAYRSYFAYLETVFALYKQDNLPEWIRPVLNGNQKEEIRADGKRFIYRVMIPVEVFYVMNGQWRQGQGFVNVYVKGEFISERSTENNPLGLTLIELRVENYVSKQDVLR